MRAFCWMVAAGALLWGWAAADADDPALPSASGEDELVPAMVPEGNATALPEALALRAGAEKHRTLQRLKNSSFPDECFTGNVTCFPKCCPLGQTYRSSRCEPIDVPFNPYVVDYDNISTGMDLLDWELESYYLVVGNPCKMRNLGWTQVNYTEIDVWSSGDLVLYFYAHSNESDILKPYNFCLEYSEKDTAAIFCIESDPDEIKAGFTSWLYTSGMLVSVSGLLLTLVVYLTLDALRDLHGKSLICHVGCLAVAYILLAAVQLSGHANFSPGVCRRMAFAIQFFLLSSFLWLHVMCLDAFWCVLEATGCSPVPYPRAKKWEYDPKCKQWMTGLDMGDIDEEKEQERRLRDKRVERRVFVFYSFYVWTLSLLPVLVILARGLSPTIPATYVDRNMELHCELHGDATKESLLYFYPFTALVIIFNIIIFICILIKAIPFQWNFSGPHRVPKQKARMCFLLFVLMSSNWVIDLISWLLGGQQIVWVMLHAFYILQGLITFLIFVLEDRVKAIIWPRIRRINRKFSCCHRANTIEEAISLQATSMPNNAEAMGWVRSNN